MNDGLTTLNELSRAWADGMVRACWQGGLAVLLVWGLCGALTRMPAAAKCWLWRLAYLKLLVALVCVPLIALPLLPAPVPRAEPAWSQPRPAHAAPVASERAVSFSLPDGGSRESMMPSREAARTSLRATSRHAIPNAATWLLAAWLLAAGWQVVRVVRTWQAVRRVLAGSRPVTDPRLTARLAQLSRQLGLRRPPLLSTSDEIGSPSLVGVFSPTVLVPSSLVQACGAGEIRLALAHELAHLRRRDLLWNWLPTLVEVLFFFHPLVWLARREWRLAQELACDETAARVSRATAAELGGLLMRIAAQRRPGRSTSLLTAEVSTSFSQISRRLIAMKCFSPLPRRQKTVAAAMVCLVVGIGVVVPWQVTAREGRTAQASPPAEAASSRETGKQAPVSSNSTPEDLVAETTVSDPAAKGADRRELPAKPSRREAIVDVNYLFLHYRRFAESMADVKKEVKAAEVKCRRKRDEIARLARLRPGTPDHRQLEEEIARQQAELQVEVQLSQKRFLRLEAGVYDATYDDIVDAVARFAEEHEIDVVYRKEATPYSRISGDNRAGVNASAQSSSRKYANSDQWKDAREAVDTAPVLRRINRQVVYRRDEWDITKDVLDILNRKHASVQTSAGEQKSESP